MTGVQTCALPICIRRLVPLHRTVRSRQKVLPLPHRPRLEHFQLREIERRIDGEETTLVSGCITVMDGINDDSGDH